jgi:hypothetical protein
MITVAANIDVDVGGLGVGVDCHIYMVRPVHPILKRI